jgi:predicted Zn finger-like uncharacterized protein
MHSLSKTQRPLVGLFSTTMVFGLFKKKSEATPAAAPVRRVVLEGVSAPPQLPTPAAPQEDPFTQRLRANGRGDFNPSESVRTSQMTCPACQTSFRIFLNSDGKKTVVKCPSCAKYYKV